ncbi:MAG: DNA-binding response regulator, partial [Deltaproteobacteria bacterium CG_4_10_14_3_um_filter_60_8]
MKKILIVDDEQSFLLSLIDMFQEQKEQFTIITALNGKKAIAILDKEPVDLVVTDLKMPEMDGFALLAHMSKATPEVPVIVMTAFGTPEMEDQILELGAFQYIEKPIEFNVLLSKIREGLKAGSKGH